MQVGEVKGLELEVIVLKAFKPKGFVLERIPFERLKLGIRLPKMLCDGRSLFVFVRHAYHSSVSALFGLSLISTLSARPERTRITRSAISQNARLWVTTATVRPVVWQVSCKSIMI